MSTRPPLRPILTSMMCLAGLACAWPGLAASRHAVRGAAPAAPEVRSEAPDPPAPAPAESLRIKIWEVSVHSRPEVAHRGQPFELHIHLVWGSPTGDEAVIPERLHHPGFELQGVGYKVASTRDQPGGGYALHAQLTYYLVPLSEGTLTLDSLNVQVVRGGAHREVRIGRTAMKVLPPVSLRPRVWNMLVFAGGGCALLAGLLMVRRRRPARTTAGGPTPEERARARLQELRGRQPSKPALAELLEFVRSEAVRLYGGAWTGSGDEAFQAWAQACRAPEIVRDRVGALVSHLEIRSYEPEDPDPGAWHHWIEETERLWRVEEALTSAGRS